MSYWARYVTRTVIRRVVVVLVAALIGWVSIGEVKAQDRYVNCFNIAFPASVYCPDLPTAVQAVEGFLAEKAAQDPRNISCGVTVTGLSVVGKMRRAGYSDTCPEGGATWTRLADSGCPAGYEWNPYSNTCIQSCSSRSYDPVPRTPVNGSLQCNTGCQVQLHDRGDGFSTVTKTGRMCKSGPEQCEGIPPEQGKFIWNPYMSVCQPVTPECPPGQKEEKGVCVREDQCPFGMVLDGKEQCVKDEGTCAVGMIRAPDGKCMKDPNPEKQCEKAGMVMGLDGTCKKDADGDGIADDDQEGEGDPNDPDGKKKSQFEGGDNCEQPPSCSGDAIMCGQARIQWRIECNTRRNQQLSGGSCDNMPICVGASCDLMQYNQLIQQWKSACAIEKLLASTKPGAGSPGGSDPEGTCPDGSAKTRDDLNCNGQPDWTENAEDGSNPDLGDEGDPDSIWVEGPTGDGVGQLDTAGWGWSRSCPIAPVVQVMGRTITFETSKFCDIMVLSGQLVLIGAALMSLKILGSGGSIT